MHLVEATLLLLLLTTIAVPWARRIGLPTEIFLVLGSLGLSLVPGLPPLVLNPAVVFTLFLPPILFAAAFFTSWRDLKRYRRAIVLLAVGLVLFTTALVAVAARALGLGMSWPVAFLLGAIVSPPDASAAAAIIKKLGVPRRMLTIIQGESLVNDATALVAYKVAISAIVTGSFSLGDASMKFLTLAAGGAGVGLIVAMAGISVVQRLNNTTAETTLLLITSFATYLCAEHLGLSGVISTVAGGLYFGCKFPRLTSAQSRLESAAFWKTVLFMINGSVFTLIGLQMPEVMTGLQGYSRLQLAIYGSAVALVVMAARFVWIFPVTYLFRKVFPSIARNEPALRRSVVTALSWVGMRGIVSLGAALSIPMTLPSGADFPFRHLIVFLTYIVILATLLIPSTTLPWLMRWLGIKDSGESRREESAARLAIYQAVLRELGLLRRSSGFSQALLDDTALLFERRVQALEDDRQPSVSRRFDEERNMRELTQRVVQSERKELERLREQAAIADAVFFQLNRELDIEETLLHTEGI